MGGGVESMHEDEARENNLVSHPKHYTFGKYEVLDVLSDWFPNDPLLWQVGKYIARAAHKDNEVQDLEKAMFYLKRRINNSKGMDKERNR